MAQDVELDPSAYLAEITELERAISLATWQQEACRREKDKLLTLAQLRQILPDRTGLVACSVTKESCQAIVVGPSGECLVNLGDSAPLSAGRVRRLRRDLRGAAFAHARPGLRHQLQDAVLSTANHLSDLIMTPVMEALGDIEQLVMVPNDLLHAVPWSLLPEWVDAR